MAFVSGLPVLPVASTPRANVAVCTRMSAGSPMSRRGVLRFAGLAGLAAAASVSGVYAADESTKKSLKEELGKIDYGDELTDVGPDAAAELQTRQKKEAETPDYVAENAEVTEEADRKFDAMVAEEKAEEAEIKAKFSKK